MERVTAQLREVAAIDLTEAVVTGGFFTDEVYERAAIDFEESKLVQVIRVIVAVNAFNRLGVTSRMILGPYSAGAAHWRPAKGQAAEDYSDSCL